MDTLPEALATALRADAKSVLDRIRTINRMRRGEELATNAQERARLSSGAARSAQSLSGEFFAGRTVAAPACAGGPSPAQIAAELERIRAGNLAMMLQKPPPSTGAWRRGLPKSGWSMLRIEDTGMPGGAQCELCEKTQMQHSYVVSHPAWPSTPPADAGAEVHACRLCAVHLLGEVKRKSPSGTPPLAGVAAARHAVRHALHEKYPHKYKVPQAKPSDNRARRRAALPEYE